MKITPAGKYRQRVTISTPSETFDSFSQPVQTFTPLITCWAFLRALSGREAMIAKQIKATATDAMTTRYLGTSITVNPTVQVTYKGRTFGVVSVQDVEERHIEYAWVLEEIQQSGQV